MAVYKLCWKESVHKDLRLLPVNIIPKIVKKAETLQVNPLPVDSKKLRDTEHSFRVRVGDYRIIYQLNSSDKEVLVCRVRHRKDAYKV